ncbi:hypothetical protein CDAR_267791 [Caerostris darwini]|uniref:Uncharacterized protein n=1 Tax=Caerostris darwini TaxID=1538125 RepID=A0AAV4UGR0_9ARAC|nr:hypothetical protein CDAR_267791 [Caerostris darwini]
MLGSNLSILQSAIQKTWNRFLSMDLLIDILVKGDHEQQATNDPNTVLYHYLLKGTVKRLQEDVFSLEETRNTQFLIPCESSHFHGRPNFHHTFTSHFHWMVLKKSSKWVVNPQIICRRGHGIPCKTV